MDTSLIVVGSSAQATEPGVRAFEFDNATSSLTPLGSFTGIANPTFLTPHPHKPWLYVASEASTGADTHGSIYALRYQTEPWAFEAINQQSSGGDGPCHVILDRTGAWVIATNYGSGSVSILPVNADGSLGVMTDHKQHHGSSVVADRQDGPHAHSAIFTPDERYVIVADLGTDQLVVYAFDAQHGILTPHEHAHAKPGAGPRHMVFHPEGNLLYVANELDNTVAAYTYDADKGTLVAGQIIDTLPANAPTSYVADIHLTSDGTHLIVSNRGHNSLAVFAIGADGALSLVAIPSCGGDWPRNFAVAPSGSAVLVANQRSGVIAVLPLGNDDVISAPASTTTVPGVSCIQWLDKLTHLP